MTGRLAGKTVLITGGARGQGAAEAALFVAEGAQVVICDILDDEGRALAKALGPAAQYHGLDVTDPGHWQSVTEALGPAGIDVLVHNAAIYWRKPLVETTPADFRAMAEVNQIGTLLALQCAHALMASGGSVVLISSTAGLRGAPDHAAYCASKHAMLGLARTAAIEFAPRDIRVNSVHPGLIDTPMVAAHFGEEGLLAYTRDQLVNRPGTPGDVAGLVLFLASDESGYCTGSVFQVDGGTLTGRRS